MTARYSLTELVFGLFLAVGALAIAVWGAAQEWSTPRVFAPVVVSWTGYLIAHHGETGRFVDEPGTGKSPSVPESKIEQITIGIVVGGMALAFPMGIHALVTDSFPLLLLAATLFVGGYVSAHQVLTGSVV